MATKMFLNMSVKDLNKSMAFFKHLGFSFNMQFTSDNGACLVLGENIFAMLCTESFFKGYTKKEIADAKKSTEVLIGIDVDSKDKVVEMVKKAQEAGGSVYMDAADHGWMYQHSFADLDGHQWEVIYMDESAIPQG